MKILSIIEARILVFTALVFIGYTSCTKYLDKKPDSSVAVPTTLDNLQALLDFTNVMNLETTPAFGAASSDDYFLLEQDYDHYVTQAQQVYTWNREDYVFPNDWAQAYTPIYNANYCLDQIDKISINDKTKSEWDNVKGSALFFRSYYFLDLLWTFSKAYDSSSFNTDLGIVLRLGSDFNVPSKRATVKECYDRVIEDTRSSIGLLPDHPQVDTRPSKEAAFGLLARAFLSMRVYDSALKYSNLCLQLNSNLIDYNGDNDINGSIDAQAPFKIFNKETLFYTEMYNGLINNSWVAKIDTLLYAKYDSNDLRKTAFFAPVGNYYKFKCIYTGDIYNYFTGIATDEIYLIRAESEAHLGDFASAMNDLNTLLSKRWRTGTFVPLTSTNSTEALNIIRTERRKELIDRGVRWIDIKRYNKENANINLKRKIKGQTYTLSPNSNYYALPLPADIIKIAGISQNPL